MDLDFSANAVLRACNVDLENFRLSKDVRYGLTQTCTTAVSFVAFLSEKLARAEKRVIKTNDVVKAAARFEMPGLVQELQEFLQSEAKARNAEKISTRNPIDVLLVKKAQDAAIEKFGSLKFPSNLTFSLNLDEE